MKGAGFSLVLTVSLGMMLPSFAQALEPPRSSYEEPGSVIIFPKFMKGTVVVDGATRAQTEIQVRAQCPNGASCRTAEPVKLRFNWICPGTEGVLLKSVCRESEFEVELPVDGKTSFNPEDPGLGANNIGSIAPCPRGYLIGWVISPVTGRPVKFDALSGSALLTDGDGSIRSYQAFSIPADPNLATRAEIATDIDPRTGTPGLVFDGGAGHYQVVAGAFPATLEYHKLTAPLSSGQAFLILLTLDVRANRPNYPTFVDLDYLADQGTRASTSWNFTCWREIQNPNIDTNFTLVGARIPNGVVLSGRAIKAPIAGVSDIPGPVVLLGLVPNDEGHGGARMDPAYIIKGSDSSKPTTVFLPFDSHASAAALR